MELETCPWQSLLSWHLLLGEMFYMIAAERLLVLAAVSLK
jgi:hypothetical protein